MVVHASTHLSNKLNVATHSAGTVCWVTWHEEPWMPGPHGCFTGNNSDCCTPSQMEIQERWADRQTVNKVPGCAGTERTLRHINPFRAGWSSTRTRVMTMPRQVPPPGQTRINSGMRPHGPARRDGCQRSRRGRNGDDEATLDPTGD